MNKAFPSAPHPIRYVQDMDPWPMGAWTHAHGPMGPIGHGPMGARPLVANELYWAREPRQIAHNGPIGPIDPYATGPLGP